MVAIGFLEATLPKHASWREYLLNASKASAWHSKSDRAQLTITADNLNDVAHDLALPAVVVVENSRNDGSFLKAVFAAYAPELCRARESNWLEFGHCGGKGEQDFVAGQAAAKFKHVVRVLIVRDNDDRLEELDDDPGNWPPVEPVLHIWRRHEVENYLPDAVLYLSDHPEAADLIRLLRQMTAKQQGFIDMKEGLPKSSPKPLFQDLDSKSQKVWKKGFGKHFPKPLVPEQVSLTVDDFRSLGEDVHEELSHLMSMIRRLV
jgi:hypothetical protein